MYTRVHVEIRIAYLLLAPISSHPSASPTKLVLRMWSSIILRRHEITKQSRSL